MEVYKEENFQTTNSKSRFENLSFCSQKVSKSLCKYIIQKAKNQYIQSKRQKVLNRQAINSSLIYTTKYQSEMRSFSNIKASASSQIKKQEDHPKVFESPVKKIQWTNRTYLSKNRSRNNLNQPQLLRNINQKRTLIKMKTQNSQLVKLDCEGQIDQEEIFIEEVRQRKKKSEKFEKDFMKNTLQVMDDDPKAKDLPIITNFLGERISLKKQKKKLSSGFRYGKVKTTVRNFKQKMLIATSQSFLSKIPQKKIVKQNTRHETEILEQTQAFFEKSKKKIKALFKQKINTNELNLNSTVFQFFSQL